MSRDHSYSNLGFAVESLTEEELMREIQRVSQVPFEDWGSMSVPVQVICLIQLEQKADLIGIHYDCLSFQDGIPMTDLWSSSCLHHFFEITHRMLGVNQQYDPESLIICVEVHWKKLPSCVAWILIIILGGSFKCLQWAHSISIWTVNNTPTSFPFVQTVISRFSAVCNRSASYWDVTSGGMAGDMLQFMFTDTGFCAILLFWEPETLWFVSVSLFPSNKF